MVDHTATHPEPSFSLPIRMEKKRKRLQVGTAGVVIGTALLGGAGYNFTYAGSYLVAIYLTIASIAMLGAGLVQLRRGVQ